MAIHVASVSSERASSLVRFASGVMGVVTDLASLREKQESMVSIYNVWDKEMVRALQLHVILIPRSQWMGPRLVRE